MCFSHLHNSFLAHAVAGGLVGVLILLGLLLTPFLINRSFDQSKQYGADGLGQA